MYPSEGSWWGWSHPPPLQREYALRVNFNPPLSPLQCDLDVVSILETAAPDVRKYVIEVLTLLIELKSLTLYIQVYPEASPLSGLLFPLLLAVLAAVVAPKRSVGHTEPAPRT